MPRSVAIIGTRGYPSYYGGFETAVRRLAPYLADHSWEVTVYGRSAGNSDQPHRGDPRVNTIITRGFETKSLSTLSHGFTAFRDVVRRRPDVALVMNSANGYFLPLLKSAGIPSLVNVDGIEWEREKWGALARAVFRTGARMTARHGTMLAFDAREIARRWRIDFGRDGVFIPYGGDVPPELPIEPGLTHRGYALIVARFVPENTVREFFDAATELARDHDVVIVGSSGYGGELDERASRLDSSSARIRWLGHVSDDRRLFSLWQHAGAYFHGHSVGGTNPALVQAMACASPIIARDTPYNREVLKSGGTFVRPVAGEIVSAIREMLSSPEAQDRSSRDGFARGREEYTWELVCAGYERSLSELLDRARESAGGGQRNAR